MKTIIRIPQGAHRSLLPSFRRGGRWLMFLMASVLLTSCLDYYDEMPTEQQNTEDMAMLRISLFTPGNSTTRSEAQIDAAVSERKIFNIRVYAFLNAEEIQASEYSGSTLEDFLDNQTALGYAIIDDVSQLTVTSDMEYQWAEMGLPKTVIGKKLDFYAMVNMKGDGFTNVEGLGYHPKRGDVEDCTFTAFGTADAKTKTAGVTATEQTTGLPASRILKGVDPVESLEGQNTLHITLLRAVGKYEFYFAKPQNLTNTKVTKIVLKGNGVPTQEFVLPDASTDNDILPHPETVTLPSTDKETGSIIYEDATIPVKDMATSVDLEALGKGTFTQVLQNMTDNSITRYGLTYVRESDTKLTGEIYYSINGVAKAEPATFEIYTKDNPEDADTDDGNTSHSHTSACFPRNHYSIVYAYFKGGNLYVKPNVQPWDLGGRYDYKTDVSARLGTLQQYLRWDIDGDLNSWLGSYVAVTHEWDNLSQVPGRTPLINLTTTSSESMYLQLDNRYFEFVVEETVGDVTTYREIGVNNRLEISSGVNVVTKFFVRPIKAYDTAENPAPSRECHMSLVNNGPVPAKVPLRSNMPGYAEGVDEVWFYWVSPDDYKEYPNATGPNGASSHYEN